jgi:ATP-dependent Clp protease ATP-binding subunit ClpA
VFERFSREAQSVLVEAQHVALELGQEHISPGHILCGCAAGREPTAGDPLRAHGITEESLRRLLPRSGETSGTEIDREALRAIGIDYEGVRKAVDQTFGSGALESAPDRRTPSSKARNRGAGIQLARRPPFSAQAKRSLGLALRVAVELHDNRIEAGHLLLGLLRLDDDFISSVVHQSGTTVARLSAAVLERVDAA